MVGPCGAMRTEHPSVRIVLVARRGDQPARWAVRAGLVRHKETRCARTQRNGRRRTKSGTGETARNDADQYAAWWSIRSLDHVIGVRIPASQPSYSPVTTYPSSRDRLSLPEQPFRRSPSPRQTERIRFVQSSPDEPDNVSRNHGVGLRSGLAVCPESDRRSP